MTKGKFYATLMIASILVFVGWSVARVNASINFDEEVGGYLDNYVEAGNTQTAIENLDMAIKALEEKGMTEGQISIFWKNPNNNVGIWYQNLLKSKKALEESLEEGKRDQAIVLEKQRNGLKGSESNSSVRTPEGISIYPLNKVYFCWCVLSIIAFLAFLIRFAVLEENCELDDPLFPERDNKVAAGA